MPSRSLRFRSGSTSTTKDICREVFRDASLDRPLSILDDGLVEKIRSAFALNPWVAKVNSVRKYHPARVKVDLVYRRPVCVVEIGTERHPVDRGRGPPAQRGLFGHGGGPLSAPGRRRGRPGDARGGSLERSARGRGGGNRRCLRAGLGEARAGDSLSLSQPARADRTQDCDVRVGHSRGDADSLGPGPEQCLPGRAVGG